MIELDAILERAHLKKRLPDPAMRVHLRRRSGLTQADVATACGVTRPTVARWEAGTRAPAGEHLDRYLALLDRLTAEAAR